MLREFIAFDNRLTGRLPGLRNMTQLGVFDVHGNNLTGEIPSVLDAPSLQEFNVDHNQLTGPPPLPVPLNFHTNARLCPNALDHVESAEWDKATGVTPWYRDCVLPDAVFADGFDG